MANEQRAHRDYLAGTLSAAVAITDTTISSSAFTALPTDYSTSRYLPLTLHDPALGVYEVVWVTGHALGSANLTVIRACEGTSARAWPSGTTVVDAPTVRDMQIVSQRAAAPTDMHIGARAVFWDEGVNAVKGADYWAPMAGVAFATQVGPSITASAMPETWWVVTMRGGYATGTTNASGQLAVSFRQPFAGGIGAVTVNSVATGTVGPFVVTNATVSGFTITAYHGTTLRASTSIQVGYIALGW